MTRTRHGLSFESRYLWLRAAHITVFPAPPRSKYKLEACENAAYYMNVSWLLSLLVYSITTAKFIVWTYRWRQGLVLGIAPVGEQTCFGCAILPISCTGTVYWIMMLSNLSHMKKCGSDMTEMADNIGLYYWAGFLSLIAYIIVVGCCGVCYMAACWPGYEEKENAAKMRAVFKLMGDGEGPGECPIS